MRKTYMRYAYGVDEASIMGMDKSRGESDVRLSLRAVEFHILLSLAAGERHGYGIILDIQARGETAVPDVGTMYRALARMAENGLIAAAARRPAADAGDERRNYYRITDAGVRAARAEVRRLEALMRAARIGGLLGKVAK
ncbi:MAG TPA: PadR family transcriptional regulator [Gemmatimonadaceae bacterium]|nr:PadR family transcriptional regulator [Gemmatimonadaceae bacterium]